MVRLAILIPVYNGQEKLNESLRSIQVPSGASLEIVVVDDGSKTPIVASGSAGLNINVIRMSENVGIVGAMNAGLDYIFQNKFDYVARLDAGDVDVSDRLSKQLSFLEQNHDVGIVGSWAEFVSEKGDVVFTQKSPESDAEIRKSMKYNNCFCHPAVMMRVSTLAVVGKYSPDFPRAEDYELFNRILKCSKGANIQEVLIETEANMDGISRSNRKEQIQTRLKIQLSALSGFDIHGLAGIGQAFISLLLPVRAAEFIKGLRS